MTPVEVVAHVCRRLDVPVGRIHGGKGPGAASRGPVAVVRARAVACWLLRLRGLSLPRIGAVVGRHHTSVLDLLRHVEGDLLETAIDLAWEVEGAEAGGLSKGPVR